MVARKIAVALMCVAVCLVVTAAQAKDKPLGGKLKSVDATKMVVTDKAGTDTSYDVSANVSVTIKGEPGKITDLMTDKPVHFTTQSVDGKTVVLTISQGHKPKN